MVRTKLKNLSIASRLYWSGSGVVQDSSFLYISNLITAGVGFISSIIVARTLGPSDFAIIAAYNAIVLTLIGFSDFGLGTALIKHATPLLKKDMKKAAEFLRAVFFIELALGAVLFILGMLLAPMLPKLLGQADISMTVVRLAVLSASIASTGAFIAAVLATYKKFKLNAIISIAFGVLRLLSTTILWKANLLSIESILGLYVLLSIFNFIVGFSLIPKDYNLKVPKQKLIKASRKIFHFSVWLTLSFFMTSVMGKLDFFYILSIKGTEDAGVYAVAQQLLQVYALLLGAIGTVLTTHVSEKIDYASMIAFLKKSLPIALIIAVLFVLSGLIAPYIINIIFGYKYALAAQPLQLLIIHLALNMILLPITLLFIPLGKVKIGTAITVLQLVVCIVLYPYLIGKVGINGAALTVIATTIVGVIVYPVILVYYLRKIKKGSYVAVS